MSRLIQMRWTLPSPSVYRNSPTAVIDMAALESSVDRLRCAWATSVVVLEDAVKEGR